MKKLLLISICILALTLCACNSSSSASLPPEQQVYINYLETGKTDFEAAIENHCQFEVNRHEPPSEETKLEISEYEILGWEQLSDRLWVVQTIIIANKFPDGNTVYNFVGTKDGEYSVMRGVHNIPDDLKAGLDLSRFISPDAL